MFGISGFELTVILVFAFLVFGPDKLPGVIKNATHIWDSLKGLREQADQVIKAEVVEPLKDIEATVNPFAEEGKSATEMLASRLGLKSQPQKKTEASAESKLQAKTDAAEGTEESAAEGTEESAAKGTEESAAESEAKSETAQQPKQAAQPKTESFAKKKARLEQAHREKLAAEQGAAEPPAAPEAKTDAPSATDLTGE
ncbi:MAG: twin-arginine translocase TatA/TatE family subunit [Coriobacteriales bacterium]|nr:twin-arginine translocase TatA/TatE family subunit [Coriobacteriales bacterium]